MHFILRTCFTYTNVTRIITIVHNSLLISTVSFQLLMICNFVEFEIFLLKSFSVNNQVLCIIVIEYYTHGLNHDYTYIDVFRLGSSIIHTIL